MGSAAPRSATRTAVVSGPRAAALAQLHRCHESDRPGFAKVVLRCCVSLCFGVRLRATRRGSAGGSLPLLQRRTGSAPYRQGRRGGLDGPRVRCVDTAREGRRYRAWRLECRGVSRCGDEMTPRSASSHRRVPMRRVSSPRRRTRSTYARATARASTRPEVCSRDRRSSRSIGSTPPTRTTSLRSRSRSAQRLRHHPPPSVRDGVG